MSALAIVQFPLGIRFCFNLLSRTTGSQKNPFAGGAVPLITYCPIDRALHVVAESQLMAAPELAFAEREAAGWANARFMFATLAEIENNGDAQPAAKTLGRSFQRRQFHIQHRSWSNFRRLTAGKEGCGFDQREHRV